MIAPSRLFDTYGRNAWLSPTLLLSLPVTSLAVVAVAIAPSWWSAMTSVASSSGLIYFGADLVQSRGKSHEAGLWENWGGAATTHRLRFRNSPNKAQVERYHTLITRLIPDLTLPSKSEEARTPARVDQAYITATKAIIGRTRDAKKFPLVYMQNYRYGFRRNLWASKGIGIVAGILSLAGVGICAMLNIRAGGTIPWLGLGFVAVLDLTLLIALVFLVTPEWVRQAADAYAEQLFVALEQF